MKVSILIGLASLFIEPVHASSTSDSLLFQLMSKAQKLDLNSDGKVDTERGFDSHGKMLWAKYDLDYDGRYDEEVDFGSTQTVRRYSSLRNGIFDQELVTQQTLAGRMMNESAFALHNGARTLIRERVPNYASGTVTVTEIKNGKTTISKHPMILDEAYADEYLKCLSKDPAAECVSTDSAYARAKNVGDSLVLASNVTPFACQTDSKFFSGTGLIIEKESCTGQRSPRSLNSKFSQALEQLDSCFNPRSGRFKNPLLHRAVIDSYSEVLHGGGISIKCHNEVSPRNPFALADANPDVSPMEINIWRPGIEGLEAKTLAHEFMHLSKKLGYIRQIDNQSAEDHNNAYITQTRDRVYACESLCFDQAPFERACNICMGYPGGETSDPACEKFASRGSVFHKLMLQRDEIDAAERSHCFSPESSANREFELICRVPYLASRVELLQKVKTYYDEHPELKAKYMSHFSSIVQGLKTELLTLVESTSVYLCEAENGGGKGRYALDLIKVRGLFESAVNNEIIRSEVSPDYKAYCSPGEVIYKKKNS